MLVKRKPVRYTARCFVRVISSERRVDAGFAIRHYYYKSQGRD